MTKDASKEIEKLTEKIKELEETIEYERKEKDKIAEEKDKIVKKFEKVKKEFEEFKAKHSIAVTNLCRAMNIKANSKNVSKPLGAPKGHAAYSRHIHERIDHVKELIPKECVDCGEPLTGKTIEVRQRFVTGLKLVWRTETTRYDIHRKRCKKCNKIVEKVVKLARVKHTDSTSWRIKGKNYFLWVFIAYGVVLYKIRKRNNAKVPLAVFGTNQKRNTLIIDRHSAL